MREFVVIGVAKGEAFAKELNESKSSSNVLKLTYCDVARERFEGLASTLDCCRSIFTLCRDLRELVLVVPLDMAINLVTPPSDLRNLRRLSVISGGPPVGVPTDSSLVQ